MKRIVRLTESDLTRLVRRIVNENTNMQAEVAIENCDENDDMAMERCVDNLFADMTEEDAENYIIELSKRKPKWLKKLAQWFRRTGRKIKREVRSIKRDFKRKEPKEKIFNVGASLTFATLATLFMKHVWLPMVGGDNSRMNESHIRRRFINEQGQGPIGGFGGPLTGTLVARNPDAEVRFGQDIEFTFRGIKNSGSAPITIKRILPMNSGMRIDKQVPFTVNPGETFVLRAKQKLVRGGTSLEKVNEEGLVEFEGIIRVETDGKKQNYQLYCRQNLSFR
jgi:hypothetical protein